jgi:AMP-polyphosphate phosphotransferase
VGRLDELDLSLSLSRERYEERLDAEQKRLVALRLALGGKLPGYEGTLGPALAVVFEGWDASGKGGALKRLVERLDPRHVRVAQYGAPTDIEKRHHFLWRFWPALPGLGGMTVFDRSWYGRVLVERVDELATPEQWERAYSTIVEFERSFCEEGGVLVKFWLHLSEDEQLKRFEERQRDPLKQWKLTDDDWKNRAKRPLYLRAVEDMLARTDHEPAPWSLVAAESKRYARVKVVETVNSAIERGMRERGLRVPTRTT